MVTDFNQELEKYLTDSDIEVSGGSGEQDTNGVERLKPELKGRDALGDGQAVSQQKQYR